MKPPLHVLWLGDSPPELPDNGYGPFMLQASPTMDDAAQALANGPYDAVVLTLTGSDGARKLLDWQALSHAVLDAAVLVLAAQASAEHAVTLMQRGVQDLVTADEVDLATLSRMLRLAVERKRIESAARKAYAIDLSTGLPNHAQLLEHMTHLLALREREPAPMALLVLRIEGLATTEAALGAEAANILRRKVAVRLRAGLRASDVVASIGTDAFAVLLAWIDAPAAGQRVAAKLVQSLQKSFNVAGQERAVAVSAGVSQYPEHGRQADELLRRAIGQASGTVAVGRAGFAAHVERGPGSAANDEGPDTVL